MQPLRLGYKASAEQFGPVELLDFSVHAEEVGFDSVVVSDHFQPWRHTGGHAPFSFAWLGALGARTERVHAGHQRGHADVSLPPVGGRAGDGHAGRCCSRTASCWASARGESLNEVPPMGIEWPDFKERWARLREAVTLMRRLWSRGSRHVRRARTTRPRMRRSTIDRRRHPAVDRRRRTADGQIRRPRRRRLHLHQWQRRRAVSRPAAARRSKKAPARRARDPATARAR